MQISTIATKLALADVKEARLFNGMFEPQPKEDWTGRLPRLKEEAERGESIVVNLPVKNGSQSLNRAMNSNPAWKAAAMACTGSRQRWTRIVARSSITKRGCARLLRWSAPVVTGQSAILFCAGVRRVAMKILPGDPCADIGERDGWRSLKAGGVNVTTKSTFRAILADWLQQSGTDREWIITHTTGWHHGAYIMPDGEVIGDPETPILFNGRSAASSGYAIAGTAATWRDSVARLAGGNPSMMLGVAAALSAPLIGLVGADGFGVHLFEQSSAGKTTTANIASSLWGEPDALRLTWYGTALGIANEAEAHNDSLLPLDEVGQGSSAKDVATSAYTLFNGAGKLQGAKEGGNRELKRWRTVAISTGEMDIETFLAAGGLKVKAGQLVRLLNIPMEKSTAFNGLPNGKAHADALKEAWIDNHGAAGREWVKWLAANQQEAKQAVRDAQTRWRGLIPADYGEQVHRVAERFAILEAALVTGASITGWSEQASRDAIQHSFNAW